MIIFTIGAFLIFLAIYSYYGKFYKYSPEKYRGIVVKYSEKYSVDPLLIEGVIYAESKGRERAVSKRGAKGLMQLMPRTAKGLAKEIGLKDFEEDDLFDREINIQLGVYYISKLKKQFNGNEYLFLAAYNAGALRVRRWVRENKGLSPKDVIKKAAFGETRIFVKKVLEYRDKEKEGGGKLKVPSSEFRVKRRGK